MNDNLTERVVAALCGPVVGTDANGYRLHLTSGQAYTLAAALLPLIREREAAAVDRELAERIRYGIESGALSEYALDRARAEGWERALREAADVMPFGYSHAAALLRECAAANPYIGNPEGVV